MFVSNASLGSALSVITDERESDISKENLSNKTNQITHTLINPTITASKTADPESGSLVPHGQIITYTISVTNTSENALANYVNVEDYLPEGTEIVEGTIITSKHTDQGKLSADGESVQFVLYDLKPQETRTVSFDVEVRDDVPDGDVIKNVAYVATSIVENGKPGDNSFLHPSDETNEIIHILEVNVDTINTGGEGWNNTIFIASIILIVLGLLFALYSRKSKQ